MDPEREEERCRGVYCMNPGGADRDLNQEDSAADEDEGGVKKCGVGWGTPLDQMWTSAEQCRRWGLACAEVGLSMVSIPYHLVHENGFPGTGQCFCRTAWILSIKYAFKVL